MTRRANTVQRRDGEVVSYDVEQRDTLRQVIDNRDPDERFSIVRRLAEQAIRGVAE